MEKKRKKLGRPRKNNLWNDKILAERSREYFDKCDSRMKMIATKKGSIPSAVPCPYSIEGLCCYLDIPRHLFDSWRKKDDTLGHRAQMIHQKITANRVEGALDGSQNPSFAQFMLKNNAPEHYREKIEVQNTVAEDVKSILEKVVESWNANSLKN